MAAKALTSNCQAGAGRALATLVGWAAASVLGWATVAATAAGVAAADWSQYDATARKLLAEMTLAEKVGQMTQAELSSLGDLQPIAALSLGSVLCGGNADPAAGNGVEAWADTYDACQTQALTSRLKIPLLFGIDAMHGHSNVSGAVIFPHNVGLGCSRNAELVEEIGRVTALEVRATGINWAFAPCITVPRDDRWGRTYEGYGETPSISGPLGAALIRGLQGQTLDDPLSVLACAKHYVGDGATAPQLVDDPATGQRKFKLDQGDAALSEAELREIHLAPYRAAIAEGVGSIMVSYSSWNGLKCTANKYLLTDVLKGELGFGGFLISDYNAIRQTDPDFKTAIKKSINAGIDMAMEPDQYATFVRHLVDLVQAGEVPEARIDDAVLRILRVKAAMGLLGSEPHVKADRSLLAEFGGPARRELARRAVRESLVVLKNEGALLPLAGDLQRIHVAGRGADDLGLQCGGWTIDWQGGLGPITPGGTTLLAALRARAAAAGVETTYSADGTGAQGADVAVVVVGENPYAEFEGDDAELTLSEEDRQVVERVRAAGVPLALVVLSGRPLALGEALDASSAVVAAWLPGTEGAGVADVLFGDAAPTGKLSFSWPRTPGQHPLNAGDANYEPQFPLGHGLTWPVE